MLISPGCHFDAVESIGAGKIVARDPESISKALLELLSNQVLLENMGASGLDFVRSQYSWDRIIEKLILVYERGINENGQRIISRKKSIQPSRLKNIGFEA